VAKKKLLIIAVSARPYVQAAKLAGFEVTAIDGFCDQETRASATETYLVPCDGVGFDAGVLIELISSLEVDGYIGFIYGAGFEMQPQLLAEITCFIPIIGNHADVVKSVKAPDDFFQVLKTLNIAYPSLINSDEEVRRHYPAILQKKQGGSGGQHISWYGQANDDHTLLAGLDENAYLQAYIEGRSISVLFSVRANNSNLMAVDLPQVLIVGFNEQWMDASEDAPFRFGGAVSHIRLSDTVESQLEDVVHKIAQAFHLVGLNSIDVIVRDAQIYVLEVNPRLSATFDLYWQVWLDEPDINLIDVHLSMSGLQMYQNQYLLSQIAPNKKVRAQANNSNALAVIYAKNNCMIDSSFIWPDWVCDKPEINHITQAGNLVKTMVIEKGMPVCSVIANGCSAIEAKEEVLVRVNFINTLLNNLNYSS
jgi:predicted ATP-grasp superfamily ATP-dependent carboligase